MKKIFHRGSCIPWFYGVAWQEDFGNKNICYPLGLHLVMRWLRDTWFLIAKPSEREWYTQEQINYIEAKAFSIGWNEAKYKIVQVIGRGNPEDSYKIQACLKANEYSLLPSSYSSINKCHEHH